MKFYFLIFSVLSTATTAYTKDLTDDNSKLKFLRWDNNNKSFLESHQRGLGGGLEYQISNNFCEKITPLFVHQMTCKILEEEIKKGLQKWERVHPLIKFTKLPSYISVESHTQNLTFAQNSIFELGLIKSPMHKSSFLNKEIKHGAEIDFHITEVTAKEQIPFFAYTDLIWSSDSPDGTLESVKQLDSYQILSVDKAIFL